MGSPLSILIVEDDLSMASLLTSFMAPVKEEFPHSEVNVVHNFEDAKRIIQSIPAPDIALMDLSLPPLKHQETISRLHEIEGRCAIVIVTGHRPEEVRKLLGGREIEIVHKEPGMIQKLFNAMHTALARINGKDHIDKAYEEAWDRLRALKSIIIPPNGPSKT